MDKAGGAWCPRNMIGHQSFDQHHHDSIINVIVIVMIMKSAGKDGGEWLQIDLGSMHVVTATETMGR